MFYMNNNLALNMFSFDSELYTLKDFEVEFLSFCASDDIKYDVTYYLHLLNSNFSLINGVIVFELNKKNLDKLISYLYEKIRTKIKESGYNTSGVYYVNFSQFSLNALDFEILRLNSPNISNIVNNDDDK